MNRKVHKNECLHQKWKDIKRNRKISIKSSINASQGARKKEKKPNPKLTGGKK